MNKTRTAGWLATAALLGTALIAPNAAFAQTGNQTNVSSSDYTENCTGGPGGSDITPKPGEVAWLFVHANGDGPGTLTANFVGAGQQQAASYIQGGVKYLIVTDAPETLTSFSDTIEGGVLTLSHVCNGGELESASVPVESESASVPVESESIPVESESIPVESASIPVESESIPVESASIPVESESVPVESESIPVETPSGSVEAESDAPSGSVDAETGTPDITPPSTDGMADGSGNSPSSSSWQLVLVALAAILATALILTPASRKTRR